MKLVINILVYSALGYRGGGCMGRGVPYRGTVQGSIGTVGFMLVLVQSPYPCTPLYPGTRTPLGPVPWVSCTWILISMLSPVQGLRARGYGTGGTWYYGVSTLSSYWLSMSYRYR